MSWRWRRAARFGPFRFTFTPRGVSTSVKVGPLRFTHRVDGTWTRTVRVPGTGLYEIESLGRQEG